MQWTGWPGRMGLVVVAGLVALAAAAADVRIAPDGMLRIDGERTFIIGLYENPADDAALSAAVEAGVNLVQSPPNAPALDRLQGVGAHAWINLGQASDLSSDRAAREAQLRQLVETLGGHPALAVWEVPDEALWNVWYAAVTWRLQREPEAQREAIAGLADAHAREELRAVRDAADRLFDEGRHAEGEALADSLWDRLDVSNTSKGPNLSDASEREAVLWGGLLDGYRMLKALDPAHPVWMNHAPRNQIDQLARFGIAADITGCDIYPAPAYARGHSDLADRALTTVGAYTERMQAAAPGKPVWMVLQGFGWADLWPRPEQTDEQRTTGRRPSSDESRFMAYDAIVRGARGILYWGTAYIEKDSELWGDLLTLSAELDAIQHVLAAPDAPVALAVSHAPTWGSVDRGVRVLPKAASDGLWLIVVNEWPDPLQYTLEGLDLFDGAAVHDAADQPAGTVAAGQFSHAISGYGVQVFRVDGSTEAMASFSGE